MISLVCVTLVEPNARCQKMPLLFYLPLIIWMGLFEVAHDEMRAPVKVKARDDDTLQWGLEPQQGTRHPDWPACRSPHGADLRKGNHLVYRLPTLTCVYRKLHPY
jgi:hypothetical protein